MLTTFLNALLSAEADSVCGADYGTCTDERTNRRNGYRHRDLDTRAGTIDVAIPKLREGSYFPEWLKLSSSPCPPTASVSTPLTPDNQPLCQAESGAAR